MEAKVKAADAELEQAMQAIETMLEDSGTKFLNGDTPSIADFQICAQSYEFVQHGLSFKPYPKLTQWKSNMWEIDGFKKVH